MQATLKTCYQKYFNWSDEKWAAFLDLCTVMGCRESLEPLFSMTYSSEYNAFSAIDSILQTYLFRAGLKNPFGSVKERYEIQGYMTARHIEAAQILKKLAIHAEKKPPKSLNIDAIFVLGSMVPNMVDRLQFTKINLLDKLSTSAMQPLVLGLTGERFLVPCQSNNGVFYPGDFSETSLYSDIFTSKELDVLQQDPYICYLKEGRVTEAGAMQLLAEKIFLSEWLSHWKVINSPATLMKTRPDTEETGYWAGLYLQEKKLYKPDFKIIIVSDAAFAEQQREEIILGLIRSGLDISQEHIAVCGGGYPDSIFESPAYIQILVSILAERTHCLKLLLERLEKNN